MTTPCGRGYNLYIIDNILTAQYSRGQNLVHKQEMKAEVIDTPIVGVNNRHKSAIDTDSVSTIATNRLLTPTNDSFHLLSAEMRRRGTHASLDFLCDGSALIVLSLLVSAGTGRVLMRFTMVCRNVRGVYDATVPYCR